MVTIRLHNSKTRVKEVFAPIDPSNVRVYVCGPTVYDRAHLGNARPVVVFDTLYRLLRHVYGGKVTYVRNFTDVDDKINATALARQQAGAAGTLEDLIKERTEETIGWYHADMDALGALRPSFEPRATEYIGPMIAMIEGLIHVRLNHRIGACLDLEAALRDRFGLDRARVMPSLGAGAATAGPAKIAADVTSSATDAPMTDFRIMVSPCGADGASY